MYDKSNPCIFLSECNVLVPALKTIVDGLNSLAIFISNEQTRLLSYNSASSQTHVAKEHFDEMKSVAEDINSLCKTFAGKLPDVRSNLMSLKENPPRMNYVDEWKQEQIDLIRNQRSQTSQGFTSNCLSMILRHKTFIFALSIAVAVGFIYRCGSKHGNR